MRMRLSSLSALIVLGLLLASCDSSSDSQPNKAENGKPSPAEKDTSLYKAMESDLDFIVHREGDMRWNGKKIVKEDKPFELEKLSEIFRLRRGIKKYQEETGNDDGPANYRVRIIIDPGAHFRNIQVIMMIAIKFGVRRFLLTHDAQHTVVELNLPGYPGNAEELARVVLCVGGEFQEHLKGRTKHGKKEKDGLVVIYVGDEKIGRVDPLGDRSELMKKLGEAVATLEKAKKNPGDYFILDADEEVESMVILHTLKTMKDHGTRNIGLVANARLTDKWNSPFEEDK